MQAEREHNNRAWLAWHIVALDRSKRLPKLQSMMARRQSRSRQSWQEQQRIMGQWIAVTKQIESWKAAIQ
jgi:hypothetical protein